MVTGDDDTDTAMDVDTMDTFTDNDLLDDAQWEASLAGKIAHF